MHNKVFHVCFTSLKDLKDVCLITLNFLKVSLVVHSVGMLNNKEINLPACDCYLAKFTCSFGWV